MNKKFFIAWLVLFIVWMAGDFLVHGVLLKSDYMQLAKLYRSDAESQAYFSRTNHWSPNSAPCCRTCS